jgi:hypothetical protein
LVVQGIYSNLRDITGFCDELVAQLHYEVAKIVERYGEEMFPIVGCGWHIRKVGSGDL